MIIEAKRPSRYMCCANMEEYCHTAQCMAWRWANPVADLPDATDEDREYGYCGLAGVPRALDKRYEE